jgi:hypothetical protein
VRIELLPRCGGRAPALDLVIRPRPLAYDAEYRVLLAEIREVAEKLCSPGSS